MKVVVEKYNRYGEKDYDEGYINWGFDDLKSQIIMAKRLESIFPRNKKNILDIACGISRYHKVWLESGYNVTGIDISETFINYSKNYNKDFENPKYYVCDFNNFNLNNHFDIAVWLDPVELTGASINRIYNTLKTDGILVYEMWNDNYYKYHNDNKHNDCQTWSHKNGVYHLIRNKYNKVTCADEHEEIIFDVPNDTMIHRTGINAKNVNSHCSIQIMEAAGFKNIRFIDYDGQPFSTENQDVKRFLMIAEK